MPNKEHQFTPLELLAKFEAPQEEVYHLGEGDAITLDVWGRPELTGKHIIGPDGRITLPIIGPVPFAGLTCEEAGNQTRKAYVEGEYYLDINATVRVDRFASNRILVLGRVSHPGPVEFDTPLTLLDAIARAGGLPVGGIGAEKAVLTRVAVFRGRDKMVWVNLKSLLTGKELGLNIRLQRNDVVYLPDGDDQLVYVMGEVARPGAFRLTPEMSFNDALALAGGPTKDAGDRILLLRPGSDIKQEVSFKEILRANARLNVSLREGDILYVTKRNLAKAGYLLERLSPLSSVILFGASLLR